MRRPPLTLRTLALLAVATVALCALRQAAACTRIFWNNNKLAMVVSRTMDWPESTEPVLTIFPRGVKHDGGRLAGAVVVPVNPATWASRYGSVVTTVYGIGTADGLNERGLAAHLLFLTATDFGPRDPSRRGLQAGLWAQYALDNAATVTEALALLEKVQVVMVESHGRQATVHLALEDASGDSAIIEILKGKSVVHHGRQYRVMTNDPVYDQQLALLAKEDYSNPSSTLTIPGNVNPVDRFHRASYYVGLLPEPKNEREAVAGVLAIARNVSVPFGAPYKDFGIYNTEYRTVCNLTNKTYYFELTTSPNVVWVDLGRENLAAGAPVMLLNPDNVALSGNVTASFRAAPAPF
jgi:penicillin V acylase-like amidase (Ntn superfamily)